MAIISSSDVNNIIRKTLNMVDKKIMEHCEIVAYTLYKMLQYENIYSAQQLVDYTMLGILHDIGLFKTGDSENLISYELKNVWEHSIYGYLFLRYLSPLKEHAEIVLYHHLDYNKHSLIQYPDMHIAEYLFFADKLDVYTRLTTDKKMSAAEYFTSNRDKTFSTRAQTLFLEAERAMHITRNLRDGSYRDELNELLSLRQFSEDYKRGFLEMLIYTIDFRSEYTVLHTLGTVTFALEIGKLMHLDKIDMYKLYYGALLHDIGKINIPIDILEAPRKLTSYEMLIMKTHTNNTEEILQGVVNKDVLNIAIRHHEKLDGSGYPYGISGDYLTLPQRINAVADILSALYQKRSYKEAFDPTKIINILKNDSACGQLCPKVVDCAIKNFSIIARNYEAKKNATMGTYIQIKEQYEMIYERFKQFE